MKHEIIFHNFLCTRPDNVHNIRNNLLAIYFDTSTFIGIVPNNYVKAVKCTLGYILANLWQIFYFVLSNGRTYVCMVWTQPCETFNVLTIMSTVGSTKQ